MTTGTAEQHDVAPVPQFGASPKILFLACYFPPSRSTASVRTWNIAKYLARRGWDVTVVTPDPSLWRHADDADKTARELEREGVKRILTGYRWRNLSPDHMRCWNEGIGWIAGGISRTIARYFGVDASIGWVSEAFRSCRRLTHEHVDIVLATGDPFAAFALAKRLASQCQCGYVLDYRDVWPLPGRGAAATRMLRQERELMRASSAVTAVSRSLLNGRHHMAEKLSVVSNGFDPDEMERVVPHKFDHVALVYTGIFYAPKRVVTPLMNALSRLRGISQHVPWRFHYYGPDGRHVEEEARRFGLIDWIVLHGRVTRQEALAALSGAHMSVVITSVLEECEPEDRGIVTGKIFDSIGLRTPILVIGPQGSDVEDILDIAGLGRVIAASDTDGIATYLQAALRGKTVAAKQPEQYAWPNVIERLDGTLRNALCQHRSQSQ